MKRLKIKFLANFCFDFGNYFNNFSCIYFTLRYKFCKTFYKFGPVDFALGLRNDKNIHLDKHILKPLFRVLVTSKLIFLLKTQNLYFYDYNKLSKHSYRRESKNHQSHQTFGFFKVRYSCCCFQQIRDLSVICSDWKLWCGSKGIWTTIPVQIPSPPPRPTNPNNTSLIHYLWTLLL